MTSDHEAEIISGARFAFGDNWARFLTELNDERVSVAETSLRVMLGVSQLKGKRFLDAGSGSGLFSLAARRMGAVVHSFDYDPQSVACTAQLKTRFFPSDPDWSVEQGSILNAGYVASLGQWDIVYSWGVLHHTGAMWLALENVAPLVAPGGQLFIAIYNDQGRSSRLWLRVKQSYNRLPRALRWLVVAPAAARLWGPTTIRDMFAGRPFATWRTYAAESLRGMSPWRDLFDWIGGLPFEVATPEQIFAFYRDRGFTLRELRTCAGGIGCNQFVFTAPNTPTSAAE